MRVFINCHVRNHPDWEIDSADSFVVDESGLFVEVGFRLHDNENYKNLPYTDLRNCYVFPAFTDAHVHFLQTGLMLVGCDLSNINSLEEMFYKLKDYSRQYSEYEWIVAWNFDETKIKDKRFPTIHELDKVIQDKKVWINRVDLHSGILNSKAISWAKDLHSNCDYEKGYINKKDYAKLFSFLIYSFPKSYKLNGLKLAENEFIKNGVTTIHALEGGWGATDDDVLLVSHFLDNSNLSYVLYHQSEDPILAIKNNWQQLGGCLMIDGSFGSRTAALTSPYNDDPYNLGALYFDESRVYNLIIKCLENNLQLAMHAIGDKGIDLLSNCYYKSYMQIRKPLKFRIEHFELPSNNAIKLVAESNVFLSVQPTFELLWGGPDKMYAKRLGVERANKTNPFKLFIENNITIAAGSDSPVTPINPFWGLYAFIEHPSPNYRISLNDALTAYILNPHLITFSKSNKGKICAGYQADFICLEDDLLKLDSESIKNVRPKSVYVKGKELYSSRAQ